ncbi:hypothetical protein FOZ62_003702, partial [Perkinsus olseni]
TEVARGDSAITGRLGEGSLALGDQASRTGNVLGYNAQAARRYQEAVESEEHITGDELKALAHRVSANDEGLLKSIAKSRGVALERAANVETAVVAFMATMNQYMEEVKQMFNTMRTSMASLDPVGEPIANNATDTSQEVMERAGEVSREVKNDLQTSKVMHSAMRHDLSEGLKQVQHDATMHQSTEKELHRQMLASSRKVEDTRRSGRESFDQWLHAREHHYDSIFVGLASELNSNGDEDDEFD